MTQSRNNLIYVILIIFSLSSFIYGFIARENSAGGGKTDFKNVWENQKIFNENSIAKSIRNTKTGEIRNSINSYFPTSYIINKVINPFSKNKESFLISIFVLNLLLPIFFFIALKNTFRKKNLYLLACFSSIIYLSPYFRTSSYWAGLENYGLLMFVISYYFLNEYLQKKNNPKLYIFLFSLFSCLCVYFDQKLALIPLIYLYFFFKNTDDTINIIFYLILNFILSIPVFLIIFYWGSIISPNDTVGRRFGSLLFFEQIGYSFSIMIFYLIPYLTIYYKKIYKFIIDNNKFFIILFIIICFYIFFLLLYPTNYTDWEHLGKGWLHKLSKIFFYDNFKQKIFIYLIFIMSIMTFFAVAQKRVALTFFSLFFTLISVLILPIFQEYFDPLICIFLMFFFYKKDEVSNSLAKLQYMFALAFLAFANFYY